MSPSVFMMLSGTLIWLLVSFPIASSFWVEQIGLIGRYRGLSSVFSNNAYRAFITGDNDAVGIPLNLPNVKNIRDISCSWPALKAKIAFRAGCVSNANESDFSFLRSYLGEKPFFRSFIDLRSPDEVAADYNLLNTEVYGSPLNYVLRGSQGIVSLILPHDKTLIPSAVMASTAKRFFISLMSENLIRKEVFQRMRRRTKLRAALLLILSKVSTKAQSLLRSIFLERINIGGLVLLNELVIENSGREIVEVLKLFCDADNFPLVTYCTAGKDRTGLIFMFVLKALGAPDEVVLADYTLSDRAYHEINDRDAVVAAMPQGGLDPDVFLVAKPETIFRVMQSIRLKYGSIDNYLDRYGFDDYWRMKLRHTMLIDSSTTKDEKGTWNNDANNLLKA